MAQLRLRWKKGAAPSHRFSLETLPGPHQRSPSLAPSSLPLPSLPSSIMRRFPSTLLPTAPGHAQQTHQQNTPPDANFLPFCSATERKIIASLCHGEVHSFPFLPINEVFSDGRLIWAA